MVNSLHNGVAVAGSHDAGVGGAFDILKMAVDGVLRRRRLQTLPAVVTQAGGHDGDGQVGGEWTQGADRGPVLQPVARLSRRPAIVAR